MTTIHSSCRACCATAAAAAGGATATTMLLTTTTMSTARPWQREEGEEGGRKWAGRREGMLALREFAVRHAAAPFSRRFPPFPANFLMPSGGRRRRACRSAIALRENRPWRAQDRLGACRAINARDLRWRYACFTVGIRSSEGTLQKRNRQTKPMVVRKVVDIVSVARYRPWKVCAAVAASLLPIKGSP